MNPDQFITELKHYESEIAAMLPRFTRNREGLYIASRDDAVLRQYVLELADLFRDALGDNHYSLDVVHEFNVAINNFTNTPSYAGVQRILSVLRSALTRFNRNPQLITRTPTDLRVRENVFVIHGRDEAKWRELKSILAGFRLNPIILLEQADPGLNTVIEKFERHAPTCSFAIAVFTPDDEVTFGGDKYLQARPNVIYELGWFCGKLGRTGAMLLLKEGTSIFSDFGGVIQKRFIRDISEKVPEIQRDLIAAGILDPT